jgi:hypothetical protein
MNSLSLLRIAAVLAILALANPARAQTFEIGAQVFLFQPGSITATLIAAPTMTLPDFWDAALFYTPQSAAGLFSSTLNNVGGSTVVTPTIALQAAPLFISTFFGTAPAGSGQGDATGTFVSTGFTDASNQPTGLHPIVANAAVVFGADHTAQIGFELPASPLPTNFSDFDLRISLTNVSSAGISPIPEPSTLTLSLVGLLAAGLIWRRRLR